MIGFIRGAESITIIIGVPLTAILNDSSHQYGRAGYYICAAAMAISAILMCFIEYPTGIHQNPFKYSTNGSIMSHCTIPTSDCGDMLNRSFSTSRCTNWYNNGPSQYTTVRNTCLSNHHPHYTPSHHCPAAVNTFTTHNPTCPNQFPNKTPQHGSLHKSLSFAFQYPTWYNLAQPNEVLPAPCYFQNEIK